MEGHPIQAAVWRALISQGVYVRERERERESVSLLTCFVQSEQSSVFITFVNIHSSLGLTLPGGVCWVRCV